MADDETNVVRPSVTLTPHHNEILDELADERFNSRSEALRAAIQHHHNYISDGGETDIEVLRSKIEDQGEVLEDIQTKIDELNSGGVSVVQGTPQQQTSDENQAESGDSAKLEIYRKLGEEGPLTPEQIAELTGIGEMSIKGCISELKAESNVCKTSEDPAEFDLQG